MSRYVVTGCAGFVGSHVCERLLARGDTVVGIDAFSDYYARELKEANVANLRNDERFTLVEADLTDAPLAELIAGTAGIFHYAAQPGIRGSWGDMFSVYARDNLVASQCVFEAALAEGVRVVWASSSSVYGDRERYPTSEDDPKRPISPYGVTKLACEHLAAAYAATGLDAVTLRYFTVYGPRQRPDMAIARIVNALRHGSQFVLFGSGEQTRDVTYVDEAAEAALAAMDVARSGAVYNIGGGSETSLRRIIEQCESLIGRRLDVRLAPSARGDVQRTSADIARARQDLGWAPRTTLDVGLRRQIAHALELEPALPVAAQFPSF